jgi:hypothetical protein
MRTPGSNQEVVDNGSSPVGMKQTQGQNNLNTTTTLIKAEVS